MKESQTKFPIPINRQALPFIITAGLLGLLVVSLGQFQPLDEALLRAAAGLPQSWRGFMHFVTDLGTSGILLTVAVTWACTELFIKRLDRALVMFASLITLPIYALAKLAVNRARPVTEFVASAGLHGESFPSGHSAGSFAVYVTLAYLLYRTLPRPWSQLLAGLSVGLALMIGFSRVYLGAHFPTDVIGGWLIASFTLMLIRYFFGKYELSRNKSGLGPAS